MNRTARMFLFGIGNLYIAWFFFTSDIPVLKVLGGISLILGVVLTLFAIAEVIDGDDKDNNE